MRSINDVEEDILELKIERAIITAIEKDGAKQESERSSFDEYKSKDNKVVAKIRRRLNVKNFFKKSYQVMPKVCAVCLAFIVVGTVFLATNKSAMAEVLRIIAERYDIHMEINIPVDETIDEDIDMTNLLTDGYYVPTYLPEGYVLDETRIRRESFKTQAFNDDGKGIVINQYCNAYSMDIDLESMDYEDKYIIDGVEVFYCINEEKTWNSIICIIDDIMIEIGGVLIEKDELLRLFTNLVLI